METGKRALGMRPCPNLIVSGHSKTHLGGKVLAKRFGLRQGENLRVIDDCTLVRVGTYIGYNKNINEL